MINANSNILGHSKSLAHLIQLHSPPAPSPTIPVHYYMEPHKAR